MICQKCARAGDLNRKLFNQPGRAWYPHPYRCGCACQCRIPEKWDSFFSVKEPDAEDS